MVAITTIPSPTLDTLLGPPTQDTPSVPLDTQATPTTLAPSTMINTSAAMVSPDSIPHTTKEYIGKSNF